MKKHYKSWAVWAAMNLAIACYFGYAIFAPASSLKGSMLPGETTHGHYQIELDCNACHAPAADDAAAGTVGLVMQDACNRCHQSQLEQAGDTHPARRFNDPTNADLLLVLNAQDCLTCHKEHVPEQTHDMGLTVPKDYCWHCHQEVGDTRPSHAEMAFDSCATAGCHNYHDNRALFEKHLYEHFGEPDVFETALLPLRKPEEPEEQQESLSKDQADAPKEKLKDKGLLNDWAETRHAAAGVNCNGCHASTDTDVASWADAVSLETCQSCHEQESESFLTGKHGMRLALGLTSKTPATARLEMHSGAAHRELSCSACHSDHRFDTKFAATQACQQCHADAHSVNYASSTHAELWEKELSGEGPVGSGVSCASCHLPRLKDEDGNVWVNHDQNACLRPNETMARQVCQSCHGLEFSLSALADPELKATCYDRAPATRTESVQMAHDWFETQRLKRERRAKKSKQ